MTPTIHEINTIHKEKVIKLKYLLYTNSTSSVGYWREVIFVLTFFGLAACLVILLIGFVNDTCAYGKSDSISNGFSRWMTSHLPRDDFVSPNLGRLLHVNNHGTDRK